MELPNIQSNNIQSYLNKDEIVLETAAQIMKDFATFGVQVNFSGNIDHAYFELHNQLVGQIDQLLIRNADLLMSILYQVDISEKEIASCQAEFPDYNQVELIAHQIIFRELKKVLFRHYFKATK